MESVVVVGAGISGLAVAGFLDRPPLVLEAADQPGGNVRTDRVDGRLLDHAANGWLDNEPAMGRLLERMGLLEHVVPASNAFKTRWIYADGRMHPAPLGPGALLTSRLLPWSAKLRLLAEPLAPRGPRDQSVGEFAARRLGPVFVERMIAPMVAGVHAGDPWQLSLAAAFPRMQELEDQYRSLFWAALRMRRGGAPRGRLQTLRGGAGELTATLAGRLGERLRCGVRVEALTRRDDVWRLSTPTGEIAARVVVLACPGPAQEAILRGLDPELSEAIAAIPYVPVGVVTTAWPQDAWEHPPEGFGVLVAGGEDFGGVLGTLFTSNVFPHEGRPDEHLMRTILGGAPAPSTLDDDDDDLVRRTINAIERFLGKAKAPPRLTHVHRHPRGIPQYTLGHPDRVARIRELEARWPGLVLTGNHLDGVGVKDCVRDGERAAARVGALLQESPPA